MKLIKLFMAALLLGGIWLSSEMIVDLRLKALERNGAIPYGPIPAHISFSYNFENLKNPFDKKVPLQRAAEFKKVEFEEMILTTLDPNIQEALKPLLSSALNYSVEYQIDPFWIMAIMMVESNFKLNALSPKNARGLMQIKPDTAQHLYQLMQKKLTYDEVISNLYHPEKNMEVGVFYLKKLLQNFRMNYERATVAYNIGPARLRNRLGEKSLDVETFTYLIKVKERYKILSQKFVMATKNKPLPFETTYVVANQGLKLEERIIGLYLGTTSENLVAFNQNL